MAPASAEGGQSRAGRPVLAPGARPPGPRSGGRRPAPVWTFRAASTSLSRFRPGGVHRPLEDTADLLDLEAKRVAVQADRRGAQIDPLFGDVDATDVLADGRRAICTSRPHRRGRAFVHHALPGPGKLGEGRFRGSGCRGRRRRAHGRRRRRGARGGQKGDHRRARRCERMARRHELSSAAAA